MHTKKRETVKRKYLHPSHNTSSLKKTSGKKTIQPVPVLPDIKEKTCKEIIDDRTVNPVDLDLREEELRQARLVIEKSRDLFRDLYEFAPVGYITLTDTAIITQANHTAASLLEVDRKKLINSPFRIWIAPEDTEIWNQYLTELLHTEKKCTATCTLIRGNGTVFPARLESIKVTLPSDNPSIRVTLSDISDMKKVEEELRINEKRFRRALQNAHMSVAMQNTNLVYEWEYNKHTRRLEDIRGKRDADIFIPEDVDDLIKLKRKTLETGKEIHEKTWLTIDGRRMFFDLYLEPVHDNTGTVTGIGITAVDQTEQKLNEDALRQSEKNLQQTQELLEAVTNGTDTIIAAQDVNFRYIFFNHAYKVEIKRLTGKDLVLGCSMVDLFKDNPDEQKIAVREWRRVLNGENVNQRLEFGDPGKYRRIYHVLHTPIRDAQGKIVGAGEVAYDVTDQVHVDEKLLETKEYLDNLITYANAPIIVWDPQFRITLFNRAFEQLTGRKAKNVIGKKLDILFHKQDLTPVMDLIRKTVEGERWESVEIPILHKKGEIRTVLWNSASITGSDRKTIISTIAQGQDITDRKRIESEFRLRATEYAKLNETLNEEIRQRIISDTNLKNTLSLLNASLESTADGIFVVDNQGKITSYNQNFAAMWNIPRDLLESADAGKVVNYLLPQLTSPEKFSANIKDFKFYPTRESFDMIEFTDGKIFERYSKPQIIGDTVVGRVWSFRDITDRKQAERKLVASLQEKEVLLREIHHRVKNNLQLISGLLDMTRMRTEDAPIYSILTDMMLKIQTMAQIHTRLYESKQFGKINIAEQIRDQVKSLSNIYSSKGHEINCEIHSNKVFLPVDLALPCALVVNEILSNAYKHAFKGRDKGTIDVTVLQENGNIRISIRDDGIGIPDSVDINRSNSLGVKLIRTLVQHQLRGSLTIHNNQGTELQVEFPLKQERQ
jgi:PAS domain S-box-containing protein